MSTTQVFFYLTHGVTNHAAPVFLLAPTPRHTPLSAPHLPMVDPTLVQRSARWSLGAQVLLTLLTASSLFLPLSDEVRTAIMPIAALETGSQVIEFSYYAIVLWRQQEIRTWTRYLDWFFSTPLMLLSTMGFLLYLASPDQGLGNVFDADTSGAAIGVLGFNWLMLGFGLVYERQLLPAWSLVAGMIAFVFSFAFLLFGFVPGTGMLGTALYTFMYIVWGLYGVAATQDDVRKNVAYNLLDIVSKNFYGVFLFVYATSTLA